GIAARTIQMPRLLYCFCPDQTQCLMNPIKSSRSEGSARISRQCGSISRHDLRQMLGLVISPPRFENVSIDLTEANEEANRLAYDDPLQNSGSRLCDPCCLRDGSGYFDVVAAPVHESNRRYHPLSHPSADAYRRL